MNAPSPFLSASLFDLALKVQNTAAKSSSRTNDKQEISELNAMVSQAYRAMLGTMEKEIPAWSQEYAQALIERWDSTVMRPYHPIYAQVTEEGASVTERVEVAFLDHGHRAWATPRGQAPLPHHLHHVFEALSRAFTLGHYTLAHRLLDWPQSGALFVEGLTAKVQGSWMSHFPAGRNQPRGMAGWGGLINKQKAAALQVLLDHGAEMPARDSEGCPFLAYASQNDVVEWMLGKSEDFLHPSRPFAQRKADVRQLLRGWKTPLSHHLIRTPGDGRSAFPAGVDYLEERLAQWPQTERESALLPWLSDRILQATLQDASTRDSIEAWVFRLTGQASLTDFSHHTIAEGGQHWTFEQWCCVRFLQGHAEDPPASLQPRVNRLAQAFSSKPTSERGVRTADLYALVAWCDPDHPKDHDLSAWVPTERLMPLLAGIMNSDTDVPQKNRDRLHTLMQAAMRAPNILDASDAATLVVAYTRWAWQEPKRSDELASAGVMGWLTQSPHAALMRAGDRHFVAVNHMNNTAFLKSEEAKGAWQFLAQAIAENGHEEDQQTPALPAPLSASGYVRQSAAYTNLIKSRDLGQQLPEPVVKATKPRF